jgi:L-fuculose-phosphate aldolase
MYSLFRDIGRDLFLQGLVSSHGGNMSVRQGDRLVITRHDAMLGRLTRADLLELGLEHDGGRGQGPEPSFDLPTHRAIYLSTPAQAIIHAHPPHTLALSMLEDEIVLVELEASYHLKRIPVLKIGIDESYSEGARDAIAAALHNHLVAVVRGHGTYSVGASLEEAYRWTSTLEANSHIVYLMGSFRRDILRHEIPGSPRLPK